MTIREAKHGDLRAMAETAAAAFKDEELYGELMHPRRREYPEDFIAYFERRFLRYCNDANRHLVVGLDKTTGKVIGCAQWEKQGVEPPSRSHSPSTGSLMQNRAADPDKINILEETFPLFAHHWHGPRRQNWYLEFLATHPDHQGQGVGKELVLWGVNRAKEDGICASVISADGKEPFYGRYGFVEVGRANVGPLGECGIKGGAIMFCEGHVS